mmetsp:Transcript_35798/g.90453  ORF Transcript_35798/g.90453 Transcript_35798/m.90453 type:complete len:235 (-) Transcript_35798:141-845(-)
MPGETRTHAGVHTFSLQLRARSRSCGCCLLLTTTCHCIQRWGLLLLSGDCLAKCICMCGAVGCIGDRCMRARTCGPLHVLLRTLHAAPPACYCCCVAAGLHQLNGGHLSCVTTAQQRLSLDAGVPALAVSIALLGTIKQALHQLLVEDEGQGLTTSVQGAILGQGNHVLGEGADDLGLHLGGADLPVLNELGHQSADEGLALVSRATQAVHSVAMAHHGEALHGAIAGTRQRGL